MIKKRFKLIIFILFFSCSNAVQAQNNAILEAIKPAHKFAGTPILKKNSQIFQIGAGFPNNLATLYGIGTALNILGLNITTASDKLGPFYADYEYFVSDDISMGFLFSYAKATQTIKDPTGFLFSTPVVAKLTGYSIGLSTSYHIYTTDKFDPYLKGSVGLNIWNMKSNSVVPITLPTPFSYSGLFGVRYFPAKWIAPYGELSYSNLKFTANLGIAFKIH